MKDAVIYLRVSTDKQTYDQQLEPCSRYCGFKNWTFDIYKEIESSGNDRPIFNEVLSKARKGEYKHIVVFRIDRAYRSTKQFVLDFDSLYNRGIDIVSVTEGLDASTIMGKGMMTMIVVFAEIEKANIGKATKDRLQALKNMGKTLGRPKGSKDKEKRSSTGYLLREAKKRGGKKVVKQYEGIS